VKINKLSVRNDTRRSIRTADRMPGSTAAAPGSPADLNPKDSTPADAPFKPPNVLKNETTTTTALDPRIPIPSSSSLNAPPTPERPEELFHQRLCSAFAGARKTLPTRKQSESVFALIPDDWERFLAWLPTAEPFKITRGPGGLPFLVDFYDADKERPEAPPIEAARGAVPLWKPPAPTKCLFCGDTGWEEITVGDKTGVRPCSCGAQIRGQYETLGGIV
jgi:hypothetical protein